MTIPIGTAVSSPAMPTSGAVAAPKIKGSNPSNAEALPAAWAWLSIASVKEDVPTTPIAVTKKKIGTTTAQSGPLKLTTASKTAPAATAVYKAISKNFFSEMRYAKRPTA